MDGITKFIFEIGALKRIHRGWLKSEGVSNPESVAEHSHRNSIVGYILAKMEGADAEKVLRMCVFHDIPEVRIGDLDKVAQHYINKDEAEMNALEDQVASLPAEISGEILSVIREMSERKSKEAIVARDADVLELCFQAKEYADIGHHGCLYWIDKNKMLLKTESAKKILESVLKTDSTSWWKGLENLR